MKVCAESGLKDILNKIKVEQQQVKGEHTKTVNDTYNNFQEVMKPVVQVDTNTYVNSITQKIGEAAEAFIEVKNSFMSKISSLCDKITDFGSKLMQSKEAIQDLSSRLDKVQPQTDIDNSHDSGLSK